MQQLVVRNCHYLPHNKPRSEQFSATSWWKPTIMYIHFNSQAWQLNKLSHTIMHRYVIGAALPVGPVSIQDLECIDGYYCG
jgi:hypothetical protein